MDSVVQVDLNEKMNDSYCFAIEGKSWRVVHQYFPEILQKLVVRGAIFARMSPEQKQQLVLELQSLGYYVGKSHRFSNEEVVLTHTLPRFSKCFTHFVAKLECSSFQSASQLII